MEAGQPFSLYLRGGELSRVHCAEPEVNDGDLLAFEAENADIFAAHHFFSRFDACCAEGLDECVFDACCESGVVDLHGRGFIFEDLDGCDLLGWQTGGEGEPGGHLLQAGDDGLTGFVAEGAGGEFELYFVGDDVALGAAVDVADGYDGGVLWVFLAADDGLNLRDVESGESDGVATELGHRSVAADAVNDDVDGGGAGHGGTGAEGDFAGRQGVGVVQADDFIGTAEALVEMVGEQGAGTVDGLLGGLADEYQRSVPLGFCCSHGAGCADEDGCVHVVTAGVHDAGALAG